MSAIGRRDRVGEPVETQTEHRCSNGWIDRDQAIPCTLCRPWTARPHWQYLEEISRPVLQPGPPPCARCGQPTHRIVVHGLCPRCAYPTPGDLPLADVPPQQSEEAR